MMMLHHLIDRRDLAIRLLRLWECDSADLTLMDQYRISANAVYPFSHDGQVRFLRFAPTTEKRSGQTESELAWLVWLNGHQYPAGQPVPSRNGKLLEFCETEYGSLQASVFSHVGGERLDRIPLSPEILQAYGQTLARLHEHSTVYHPAAGTAPWTWRDVLAWSLSVLVHTPVLPAGAYGPDFNLLSDSDLETDSASALEAVDELTCFFETLPTDPEHYGLIHFDFEPDNVFWHPDEAQCIPIDFDDAMVHWYLADVARALESLRECVSDSMEDAAENEGGSPPDESLRLDRQNAACGAFLSGYRSIRELKEESIALLPSFHRFSALYGYARIVRALSIVNHEEPDWMGNLRFHLHGLMNERKEIFKCRTGPTSP